MSGFIPDPYERTVKVPVMFVDGVPKPYFGGSWPAIKEGTIGELVLPAWSFVRPQDAVLLSAPLTAPILSKGEELLVALNASAHGDDLLQSRDLPILPTFRRFAKIRLEDELRLTLRGTKKASLDSCRCLLPALDKTVDSLNEAYTQLSIHYEPHRRSHTGNVFRHFFFRSKDRAGKAIWQPLDRKRQAIETKLTRRFQSKDSSAQ